MTSNNQRRPTGRNRRRRRMRRQEIIFYRCMGILMLLGILLLLVGGGFLLKKLFSGSGKQKETKPLQTTVTEMASQPEGTSADGQPIPGETVTDGLQTGAPVPGETVPKGDWTDPIPAFQMVFGYQASPAASVKSPAESDVQSSYAVLINGKTGEITAQKNARTKIYPASMTKILTVLVAAERVKDIDDTFTVTLECTDYAFRHKCSTAGFLNDETVPVKDLFYGTILPSGGEAAYALAVYTAGSHEAFVELMNRKVAELGLSDTSHFTNCVGIFDEANYSTCYDMAMILKAAMENPWCREVLSRHKYVTEKTEQHPNGIELSNWFLRRIEDKDTKGTVWCAKTGFVNQSGNCGASFLLDQKGTPYICVTGDAHSSWRCIYDHVSLYAKYR